MSSSVPIYLFGENCIGRYYQLAAVAAIYDALDPSLRKKIESGVEFGRVELALSELKALMDTLVDYLESRVCQVKEKGYGPTLYRAGARDREILSSMGLTVEKALTCSSIIEYHKGGFLLQRAFSTVKVPMYLRTYVFSVYRDMEEVEDTNIASLYLATAGTYISMIGRVAKGEERYELYINPDFSIATLRVASRMYSLLNEPRSKVKLPGLIQDVLNLEGVSLELASIFSIALYTYHVAKHVLNLQSLANYYNVFERFKLVCIKPEDRPLVIWEKPLTLTYFISSLEAVNALDLLEALGSSMGSALKLREEIGGFAESISACINDLYAYLETKVPDTVVHCVSGLSRLFDALDEACRKGNERACNAEKSIYRLIHYTTRLKLE